MAFKSPLGGGNYLEVFAFNKSTNTIGASAFVFDKTVTTAINGHPAKGVEFTIDLDSKINNEAFETFITNYLTTISTETIEQIYEDDSKDTSTSAASEADYFAFILHNKALDSKVKTLIGIGYLTGDTGNDSRAAGTANTNPVQITVTSVSSEVAFGIALFDDTKVTVGTAQALPADAYGKYLFLTQAS